jgi:hypothetical protein
MDMQSATLDFSIQRISNHNSNVYWWLHCLFPLEHPQWHLDRAMGLNFQWFNPVGFQKKGPMEPWLGPWTCSPHCDVALGRDYLILFQSTQQAPWSSRFPAMAIVATKPLSKSTKNSKNIKDPGSYHWEALACSFLVPTLHADPCPANNRPRAWFRGPHWACP